jgi:hypothetical protein
VDTVSRAIERAALAIFNNRKQSGGALRARGDARAGLEEALNVDEISTIINESIMGYGARSVCTGLSAFSPISTTGQ